jgi:nucleoside-triphosphatase
MEAVDVANYVLGRYRRADLVAIDEIGPMELRLPGIRRVIEEILQIDKPGLFVVHERLRDDRIQPLLEEKSCVFTVTFENRDHLADDIMKAVLSVLGRRAG